MAHKKTPDRKKRYVANPRDPRLKPLNNQERLFVDEYLIRNDVIQAAIAAGYSVSVARSRAYEWIRDPQHKPHVYHAIETAIAERAKRLQITADMVLARWWQIATADPNELTQHRRDCCRHCYGRDHAYQWRDHAEFEQAIETAANDDQTLPTDEGGYGFTHALPPHPQCPHCDGEGEAIVYVADTRRLSPGARAMFAGVKQTQQGLEIKMHDQAKALENVARHLGMFQLDVNHGLQAGSPLDRILQAVTGEVLGPVDEPPPEE